MALNVRLLGLPGYPRENSDEEPGNAPAYEKIVVTKSSGDDQAEDEQHSRDGEY
jgi:hypothetical protein